MFEELDQLLDDLVLRPFQARMLDVLFHYTSWAGAESILRTRSFWATSHRDTDDPTELRAIDEVILGVVAALRGRSSDAALQVWDAFVTRFSETKVSSAFDVYITCFSATRDSSLHWTTYGGGGDGVCLGISMLRDEELPAGDEPRFFTPIEYSAETWQRKIEASFSGIVGQFVRFVSGRHTSNDKTRALRATLSALSRTAALAEIAAKEQHYSDECEWRSALLSRKDSSLRRQHRDVRGRRIEYVETPARSGDRAIVLTEIMLGPKNGPEAEHRAREMLTQVGYGSVGLAMPTIVRSAY
jgi:hypothetical protein